MRTPPQTSQAKQELTEAEWEIIRMAWRHKSRAAVTLREALAEFKGWACGAVLRWRLGFPQIKSPDPMKELRFERVVNHRRKTV